MMIAKRWTKTQLRQMNAGFGKAQVETFFYNDNIPRYIVFVKRGRKADSIWVIDSYCAWESEYLDMWNDVYSDGNGRIEPENPEYTVVKVIEVKE